MYKNYLFSERLFTELQITVLKGCGRNVDTYHKIQISLRYKLLYDTFFELCMFNVMHIYHFGLIID
jgi:hypothetical protein